MKLRNFVSIFSLILMFIGASFGVFYLITGQNILTGQNRNARDVLPASDSSNLGEKIGTNSVPKLTPKKTEKPVEQEKLNPDLLKFNEVMAKTSNKFSFTLKPVSNEDEASVVVRFGQGDKELYVASYASGLKETIKQYVWLRQGAESFVRVGELKKVDDSGVLKTSLILSEGKITDFNKAYVVNKDVEDTVDIKDVIFSIDLVFAQDNTGVSDVNGKTTPNPTKTP